MREKIFIGIGIAMALAFAWAATQPAGAPTGAKLWHQAIHFAAVAAFGVLQECYEIYGHRHPFEFLDVLADALGAITGGVGARLSVRL